MSQQILLGRNANFSKVILLPTDSRKLDKRIWFFRERTLKLEDDLIDLFILFEQRSELNLIYWRLWVIFLAIEGKSTDPYIKGTMFYKSLGITFNSLLYQSESVFSPVNTNKGKRKLIRG